MFLNPVDKPFMGVLIDRPLMTLMFQSLGYLLKFKIEEHHFSTEKGVFSVTCNKLQLVRLTRMTTIAGPVYEGGHFIKTA